MAKTVFDVLQDKLLEHRKSHVDFLAGGGAADFAVYQAQWGLIRGLDIALREVTDLAQHVLDNDDD